MDLCPICTCRMTTGRFTSPATRTRDHILPKFRGGMRTIHGDVTNVRVMCQECNNRIAQCGQCIGAFACAYEVSEYSGQGFWDVLRDWGFGRITERLIRNAMDRVAAEDRSARAAVLALEPRATFMDLARGRRRYG